MSKLYLAGTYTRSYVIKEAMNLFLAGHAPWRDNGIYDQTIIDNKPYILESFYSIKDDKNWILKMRPYFKDFLLDSGAFTFMNDLKKEQPNWDQYIEQYAEFINENKIELFFELDIDAVIGIKKVEQLRTKLEQLTNKQAIPVWHKSRGLDYWKKMCSEYNYVAIGGIVTNEIKRSEYDVFLPLLKIARERNCKVHGLGFTNIKGLKKYKFYSVDSTAWLYGNRGGYLYQFNNGDMKQIKPDGKKLKGKAGALHNFIEWVKFAKYAERHL